MNHLFCLEAFEEGSTKQHMEPSHVLTWTGRNRELGMTKASGKWRLHSDLNDIADLLAWMLHENVSRASTTSKRDKLYLRSWLERLIHVLKSRNQNDTRGIKKNDAPFWLQRHCFRSSWKQRECFIAVKSSSRRNEQGLVRQISFSKIT